MTQPEQEPPTQTEMWEEEKDHALLGNMQPDTSQTDEVVEEEKK